MLDIARKLIVFATEEKNGTATAIPVFVVCDSLRPHLATLMGKIGFRALLSRALALASIEVPWLRALHVDADGRLAGFDGLDGRLGPEEGLEGRVILLAQLLGLLVAFIGEDLTLRLVRDIWPALSLEKSDFGRGNNNEKPR